MKKIIALLLALVCMVSLFACGDDPDPDTGDTGDTGSTGGTGGTGGNQNSSELMEKLNEVIANYNDAIADSVIATKITYSSPDGKVEEEIESEIIGSDLIFEGDKDDEAVLPILKVPNFNYVTYDDKGMITMPDTLSGTITGNYANERVTPVNLAGFNFKLEYFKNNTFSYESRVFKATIVNCSGFFGANLTQNEADITITFTNGTPKRVEISYTTPLGYEVDILLRCNY